MTWRLSRDKETQRTFEAPKKEISKHLTFLKDATHRTQLSLRTLKQSLSNQTALKETEKIDTALMLPTEPGKT